MKKTFQPLTFILLFALASFTLFASDSLSSVCRKNTLTSVDGKSLTLEQFKGKKVLVVFWASWCSHCRHELPDIQKIYDKYRSHLEVVAISADDDQGAMKAYLAQNHYTFPVVLITPEVEKCFGGIEGFPTTFLLDSDLNIVNKFLGYTEGNIIEDSIKK